MCGRLESLWVAINHLANPSGFLIATTQDMAEMTVLQQNWCKTTNPGVTVVPKLKTSRGAAVDRSQAEKVQGQRRASVEVVCGTNTGVVPAIWEHRNLGWRMRIFHHTNRDYVAGICRENFSCQSVTKCCQQDIGDR